MSRKSLVFHEEWVTRPDQILSQESIFSFKMGAKMPDANPYKWTIWHPAWIFSIVGFKMCPQFACLSKHPKRGNLWIPKSAILNFPQKDCPRIGESRLHWLQSQDCHFPLLRSMFSHWFTHVFLNKLRLKSRSRKPFRFLDVCAWVEANSHWLHLFGFSSLRERCKSCHPSIWEFNYCCWLGCEIAQQRPICNGLYFTFRVVKVWCILFERWHMKASSDQDFKSKQFSQ